MTRELTAITRSVAEFRNALESADLEFLPTLADFPYGSCGITADQFHDIDSPVLITDDHTWHNQFVSEVKHVAGWETYDNRARSTLARAYKTVISTMDEVRQIVGPEPGAVPHQA